MPSPCLPAWWRRGVGEVGDLLFFPFPSYLCLPHLPPFPCTLCLVLACLPTYAWCCIHFLLNFPSLGGGQWVVGGWVVTDWALLLPSCTPHHHATTCLPLLSLPHACLPCLLPPYPYLPFLCLLCPWGGRVLLPLETVVRQILIQTELHCGGGGGSRWQWSGEAGTTLHTCPSGEDAPPLCPLPLPPA